MGSTTKARIGWLGVAAAAGLAAPLAMGQEAEKKVSGTFGVDLNTHFISYGFDVGAADDGDDFASGMDWGDPRYNPYAELSLDFSPITLTFGTWWDVTVFGEDHYDPTVGGNINEVDVYVGAGYDIDKFSLGLTYQEWYYGGGVERIVDLSVGYDDTGLIADDFALNPYLLIHGRVGDEDLDINEGIVFVAGIEPGFTIVDTEDLTVDLSIPVAVGIATDEYHGDDLDGGLAYVSVGGFVSVPLTFIPAEYGDWALGAGLTYYHTPDDVTGNDTNGGDENFVTGTIGLSLAF